VRRAVDRGVRISLGSDGHTAAVPAARAPRAPRRGPRRPHLAGFRRTYRRAGG
jgi:hypothetical protein